MSFTYPTDSPEDGQYVLVDIAAVMTQSQFREGAFYGGATFETLQAGVTVWDVMPVVPSQSALNVLAKDT